MPNVCRPVSSERRSGTPVFDCVSVLPAYGIPSRVEVICDSGGANDCDIVGQVMVNCVPYLLVIQIGLNGERTDLSCSVHAGIRAAGHM